MLALELVIQEIGIGLAVGLGLASIGTRLIKLCWNRAWMTEIWMQVTVVGLAIACFSVAQSLHGSGYIAAFVGGIVFGYRAKEETHKLVLAAEGIGETLALVTWMLFGAMAIGQTYEFFTWQVVVYALLSLTVVRMLPVYLSLSGTSEDARSRLFLGWFGPRGLASLVFAIIVLNAKLPGSKLIALVVICTVFFSLIAHGISANPLAKKMAGRE
jgi:NhaP-type Na+/H+ or K+/H+ antiporter